MARRTNNRVFIALLSAVLFIFWIRIALPVNGSPASISEPPTQVHFENRDPQSPTYDLYNIVYEAHQQLDLGSKVAVIIETRPLDNLVPLLLHFASVLGPSWPVVLVTSLPYLPNSAPFQRALKAGSIKILALPADYTDFAHHSVLSVFLTSTWLWEQFAPADHVLLFQSDSIICANAEQHVDDFLMYDLIGAPIREGWGHGYNGGFSLRNRNTVMDVLTRWNFAAELAAAKKALQPGEALEMTTEYEDQWLYKKMALGLPEKFPGVPAARLPTQEEAMKFGVETVWYDKPLGFHQVEKFNKDHLDVVEKWCPEYKLALHEYLPVGEESHG